MAASSADRLITSAVVACTATAEADRGPWSITDSSPRTSPAPTVASTISSPRSEATVILTRPSTMTTR